MNRTKEEIPEFKKSIEEMNPDRKKIVDLFLELESEKQKSKELFEALEYLVKRVEVLSLWDKTDASYYKAKAAIDKYQK